MTKKHFGLFTVIILAGCDVPSTPPDSRVQAQDLQPVSGISTEVVAMSLDRREQLLRLADIVRKDPPSTAELGCPPSDMLCLEARSILEKKGVPIKMTGGGKDARLIYEYVATGSAPYQPPSDAAAASALSPAAAPQSGLPKPSLLLQSMPR